MARPRIPDCELTEAQLKRRERNDKYRAKSLALVQGKRDPKKALSQIESQLVSKNIKTAFPNLQRAAGIKLVALTSNTFGKMKKISPLKTVVNFSLILLLIVCCTLSYHLQVELYESLSILPDKMVLGLKFTTIASALIEVLLVVLAGFVCQGRNTLEKIFSGILFLVIGVGTAFLMYYDQEKKKSNTVEKLISENQAQPIQSPEITKLTNKRNLYNQELTANLAQIDPNVKGSYASSGAIGLVRDANNRIAEIRKEIERIDKEIIANKANSESATKLMPKKDIIKQKTAAAEAFRILLLIVTAFLVHAILARIMEVSPLKPIVADG